MNECIKKCGEIDELKKQSVQSKRRLAEETRDFKKLPLESSGEELDVLLKSYQVRDPVSIVSQHSVGRNRVSFKEIQSK